MRTCPRVLSILALASFAAAAGDAAVAHGAETARQYLSGRGKDDAVTWDFMCNAGMKANQWSTIKVPSNWELQGYGIYTYGREQHRNGWPKVQGKYKRTFNVPEAWAGKTVNLVFDGSMTDTQAFINGQSAGPMHQGGYYRFKYDVTKLLKPGENLLEVTVDDESANASINAAERRADYWNFAGIFRPVYLEALPPIHVQRVAINAAADGAFDMDVFVTPGETPLRITGRILDMQGRQVGSGMDVMIGTGQAGPARLATRIGSPRQWTAETPNLYQVEVNVGTGGTIDHTIKQRFGFRTIEVRRGGPAAVGGGGAAATAPAGTRPAAAGAGAGRGGMATGAADNTSETSGLFVNGQRIMLKGANRHSFWPDSGRCLSPAISREDILLMQSMNMNAVRMSHYPPDEHFLDLCDELGMYVLDELAGWHQKYDTPTGRRLIEQMVTRDVNHPSILFWDNGNEGGWNTELDDDFAKWDPQARPVLHPWNPFRGIDTKHYPVWSQHQQKAAGNDLYMPTEMLHGLFDGGAGAGLEDYWNVLRESKVGAGGFIWALTDETVRRTDQNGRLDPQGNQAPDGIVGPYREKEGSFYTVKKLWSPIAITRNNGAFTVENRYGFLDAQNCTYTVEHRQLPRPGAGTSNARITQRYDAKTEGSIPPGASGKLVFPAASATGESDRAPGASELIALVVKDPAGRELWTHTWPDRHFTANFSGLLTRSAWGWVTAVEQGDAFKVTAGALVVTFDRTTGHLASVSRDGKPFSISNGLRLLKDGPAGASATAAAPPRLTSLQHRSDGSDLLVTASYSGDLREVTYRLRPNGWITMDYAYRATGPHHYFGVAFDYPQTQVKAMRYLGEGPYRVWKNRLQGTTLGVWDKPFNDTATGHPATDQSGTFEYPEFKGYYAGVRWLQLQTAEGPITLLVDQQDATDAENKSPIYVQVLTPRLPTGQLAMRSGVPVGTAGLAFLHAIPPIGNKFNEPAVTGPQGQWPVGTGEYRGRVSLYVGSLEE